MYFKDKERVVRVRLSEEQLSKLIALAELSGISVSELIRQAINRL